VTTFLHWYHFVLFWSFDGVSALRVRGSTQGWSAVQTRTVVSVTWTEATTEMPRFTNVEFPDTDFVYGFCDGNSLAALREYQRRYPDRRQPYRRAFETAHRNLRETDTVMPHAHAGRGRRKCGWGGLSYTTTHQHALDIPSATGRLSQSVIVWRYLCDNQSYAFHVQPVQGLQPGDNISVCSFLNGW
jgi:hypothetical protein